VPGVEQELAQDRAPEIAVGLFDQQEVPEIPGIAQEGEVIGAAPLPLDLSGQAQPHLRLADQVERGVGERDILLQHRRMTAPFADPVAEDQRVVPHPQEELEQVVIRLVQRSGRRARTPHHMCPASSGMSKKLGCR
jgi:hypothetical protein